MLNAPRKGTCGLRIASSIPPGASRVHIVLSLGVVAAKELTLQRNNSR